MNLMSYARLCNLRGKSHASSAVRHRSTDGDSSAVQVRLRPSQLTALTDLESRGGPGAPRRLAIGASASQRSAFPQVACIEPRGHGPPRAGPGSLSCYEIAFAQLPGCRSRFSRCPARSRGQDLGSAMGLRKIGATSSFRQCWQCFQLCLEPELAAQIIKLF